jgi:molybdopterin-containing oxidoreductase family membrane subunit
MMPLFNSKKADSEHLQTLFTGAYSIPFWIVTIGGLVLPTILMLFKKGRKPLPIFLVSILVVIGAWWKRYIIVTPTLMHPFLPIQGVPESWRTYFPSLHEWVITSATLAMALLIITLLVRYLPIIPIQRTMDEQELNKTENKTAL